MFKWIERSNIPQYTHEMLHYRNAMAKEVNFAFSNQSENLESDKDLQEQFERFKDHREKTGNRIKKESERNNVWLDLLLDVFKSSVDFTAADLFLKYFNIPNEAINADFFFAMREANSVFDQLIRDEAFGTALQFLSFFPPSDALSEFQYMLSTAEEKSNSKAILLLAENIFLEPFDSLLRDEETRDILNKEYKKAEKDKRVADARKLAEILKDSDLLRRIKALEAMLKNNHHEAITHLKEIVEISEFQPLVEEFYDSAMDKGKHNVDMEQYKIAFSYAKFGKLSKKDKRFTEDPAGYIFKSYVTKSSSNETDYYEAEQYRDSCDDSLVQNVVAEKMLELIQNNDRTVAKNLKKRFKVVFQAAGYKYEKEIKKFYKNLVETYGAYDVPKGEENLLTALDIAELYNFQTEDIEAIKFLLCKFYIINKIFESAKRYYSAKNADLNDLVVKHLNSSIELKDYDGAYGLFKALPIRFHRSDREDRQKEVKNLRASGELTLRQLGHALILDDIYELNILPSSYYRDAFTRGLNSGPDGIQFLVDLRTPLKKKMESCTKIRLSNAIKRFIASDRLSADILNRTYEKYVHPDNLDYILYFFKRLMGMC